MKKIEDPLDELLKLDVHAHREAYIDDAGFTLRVMDAVPARRSVSRAMKLGLPFGFALMAALLVIVFAGGKNFLIDVTMDLATETITRNVVALALIAVALFAMLIANLVNDK